MSSRIALYQVDTFSSQVFHGNPAAVCPLGNWLPENLLQKIAAENNLSETAFFVKEAEDYRVRWFTPKSEISLCGHATLASAFVIFNFIEPTRQLIKFSSIGGELVVEKNDKFLALTLPAKKLVAQDPPLELIQAVGQKPAEVFLSEDYICVLKEEKEVRDFKPDLQLLSKVECVGIAITTPGSDCDFVSRYFAPRYGIDEDPVTGRSHTLLIPYWAKRLKKNSLVAKQLSPRGGELVCEDLGDKVKISGEVVLYLKGEIEI